MSISLEDHFWSKVDKTRNCWIWKAGKNSDGYGEFWYNSKHVKAHRLSYELLRGKIPEDKEIDHLCRNRACVNPEHLELVTHKENVRRGLSGWEGAIKTHCEQGHEYTEENTLISRKGWRRCKICNRERCLNWWKRQE